MSTVRCPKHDRVFDTTTDHRLPGAPAKDGLQAHPLNGHPDCDLCRAEAREKISPVVSRSQNSGVAMSRPQVVTN